MLANTLTNKMKNMSSTKAITMEVHYQGTLGTIVILNTFTLVEAEVIVSIYNWVTKAAL